MQFKNTELYSYVASASFLIVSIISPILSGIADYSDSKKRFLQFFCYLGALSCASLYFFDINHLEWSMLPVLLASVGFWGSLVFYNAYLPEIAQPEMHDRISAKGYALGYVGSSILLIINFGNDYGFRYSSQVYFSNCCNMVDRFSVNILMQNFQIMYFSNKPKENKFTKGWKELKQVWNQTKTLKVLKRYLLSFFVYSMRCSNRDVNGDIIRS